MNGINIHQTVQLQCMPFKSGCYEHFGVCGIYHFLYCQSLTTECVCIVCVCDSWCCTVKHIYEGENQLIRGKNGFKILLKNLGEISLQTHLHQGKIVARMSVLKLLKMLSTGCLCFNWTWLIVVSTCPQYALVIQSTTIQDKKWPQKTKINAQCGQAD